MALKGININETFEVVSKFDDAITDESKTRFIFGVLTNEDKLNVLSIASEINKEGSDVKVMYKSSLALIKKHLKTIKNFDGRNHESEADINKVLSVLPIEIILDLSKEIMDKNFIQDKEAKN